MTLHLPKTAIYPTDRNWHEVGALGEPAFQNSWVNYDGGHWTAGFRMDADGWVHLKGLVKSGTSGQYVFTLPAGYRPMNLLGRVHRGTVVGTAKSGVVYVDADGGVQVFVGTGTNAYATLDGIRFPVWEHDSEFAQAGWRQASNAPYYNNTAMSHVGMVKRSNGMLVFLGRSGATSGTIDWSNNDTDNFRAEILPISGTGSTFCQLRARRSNITSIGTSSGYGACTGQQFSTLDNESQWIDATLINSWVPLGSTSEDWAAPQYFKDHNGYVHLRGLAKSGSSASADLFTLPEGFRPGGRLMFPAVSIAGFARVDISAGGVVDVPNGGSTTWNSISGISFYADG